MQATSTHTLESSARGARRHTSSTRRKQPSRSRSRSRSRWLQGLLALPLALSLGLVANDATAGPSKAKPWKNGNGESVVLDSSYNPALSLAPLIKSVAPAVVSIRARQGKASSKVRPSPIPPGFQMPFGMPGPHPHHGGATGSGFIFTADGLVLTNHHVIDGRDEIRVELADGRDFRAQLVGSDPQTDVAVLQLERATGLPHVVFGSSEKLAVGDWVLAIGSPLGLDRTVTRGIVSAKGRGDLGLYERGYADFLQTDAAISPGNSGGPLFNLSGEVIAINTAISRSGNDLGFAIPIDQVKNVVPQLLQHGKVARGWLGVLGDMEIRKAADEGDSAPRPAARDGAVLTQVQKQGPAWRAGLRDGDRITHVEGRSISNFADLRARIGEHRPGSKVRVEYERGHEKRSTSIELGRQPDGNTLAQWGRGFPGEGDRPDGSESLYGPGPARLGVRVSTDDGRIVVRGLSQAEGVGAQLGLKPGDQITQINGQKIESLADLRRALEADRKRVEVEFKREGTTRVSVMMSR